MYICKFLPRLKYGYFTYTTLLCGCNGRQDGLWASLLDYTSRGLGLSPDCALFFGATFYSHIASFYSGGGRLVTGSRLLGKLQLRLELLTLCSGYLGWWDVSQSLMARKYTIFLNLLSGRGLDSYRVGHLAWIWCCTTSCFRRNELKGHPLNILRDLPKDEFGISITTS